MIFNNYLVVISLVAIAAAQSSVSLSVSGTDSASGPLPSISPCILGCTEPAATAAGCTSITDLACICNSTQFQQAAAACLQANCTSSEVTSALGLQSAECASVGGAISSSASISALPSSLSSSPSLSPSLPVSVSSTSASGTSARALTTPSSSATRSTTAVSTSASPASTGTGTSTGASTGAASSIVANIWGVTIGLVGAAAAAALL